MAPAVAASLSTVAATVHTNSDVVATLAEKSVPTFAGLATIPFIVHPIDETVHAILNVSMRPALRKFLCVNGQGQSAGLKICDETCMKADFPVLSGAFDSWPSLVPECVCALQKRRISLKHSQNLLKKSLCRIVL